MGGLEVLDPRYPALYERTLEVLSADDRVKGVLLSGSVATGTADRWSDLDLQVVTHAARHEEFLADWPQWLARITPTVFARTPLAPFIINTVTDEGLPLDLAVYAEQPPPPYVPQTGEHVVGMLSGRRFTNIADALDYAVAEQLRGLAGPFLSLLQRDEHVRHITGLPPLQATREAIIAFGLGLAELLVTRARPLFDTYDLRWPADLAAVAAERLRTVLDIDATSWLR
jgi:hypothetical protein